MYSLANIATGFVQDVETYRMLRFVGGIGLAGELGAGVTLALESMPKHIRGMGGAIIAGFGVLGAVMAEGILAFVSWREAYILGGVMGLGVMVLRLRLHESEMFIKHKADHVEHGNFLALIRRPDLVRKYIACILIGVPVWFTIGLLAYFSPEFAKELGVTGPVSAGRGIMYTYIGLSVGDISSGLLSQWLKSRRQALGIFISFLALGGIVYSQAHGVTPSQFYGILFFLGVAAGYWSLMAINASEQFGVNFRATAATSVPNFVRGSVVPMTLAFGALKGSLGMITAAAVVGAVVFVLAAVALWHLPETFDKDLNHVE
jgi:MFS family permease